MRIGSGGEVIVTGIQNVGACAVGVKAGNVALVDGHLDGLACTGGQLGSLAEADQRHGGLLHAVGLVILGVGALNVDLHGLLTGHSAGVRDLDADVIGIVGGIILHVHIAVAEIGVGQAIAEGIGHNVAVGVVPRVAASGDKVLIAGLVVLVAYVDALLINHIGAALFGDIAALNIAVIDGGREVPHSGGAVVIVAVGIHQAAGGVHIADQNLGHGVDAGDAHIANPEGGVNVILVVLQEIDLQGIGRVDEHNNLLNLAVLLHLGQIGKQCLLILVECQIVDLAVGQVCALAADAGEGDDGGIAVVGHAVFHLIGVDVPRHLRGSRALGGNRTAACAGVVLTGTGGVEVPQRGVDGCAHLFQRGAQGVGGGSVNVAGARAAIDQVHTGGREGADLRVLGKRQGVVVVHEQGCALGLDLLAEHETVVHHLLRGSEVTGEVLCVGVLVFQLPEGTTNKRRNRVVEGGENLGKRDEYDHEHSAEDCQNLPRQHGLALGLFVGFFQRFLLCFDFVHDFLLTVFVTAKVSFPVVHVN